jgi:hypothetical protein
MNIQNFDKNKVYFKAILLAIFNRRVLNPRSFPSGIPDIVFIISMIIKSIIYAYYMLQSHVLM